MERVPGFSARYTELPSIQSASSRTYIWRLSLRPRVIEVRPTGEETLDEDREIYPVQPAGPPAFDHPCRSNPYGYRKYSVDDTLPIGERGAAEVTGWPLPKTPHPPQFFACRESRQETMPLYEPCDELTFHAAKAPAYGSAKKAIATMINYEIDTVYCPQSVKAYCNCATQDGCVFPDSNVFWRLAIRKEAASKIRSLAVSYGSFEHMCEYHPPPTYRQIGYLNRFDVKKTMPKYKNLRELVFIKLDAAGGNHRSEREGPAHVRYLDDPMITEIQSDPISSNIPKEYTELKQPLVLVHEENDDDYLPWYHRHEEYLPHESQERRKKLQARRQGIFMLGRDWRADKNILLERFREIEELGKWQSPTSVRLLLTTRKIQGYLR